MGRVRSVERIRAETPAVIGHGQEDLFRSAIEVDGDVLGLRVFEGVAQGFLGEAEELVFRIGC